MARHRIALVVNPASGVGRAARLASAVATRLGAGASVQVHEGTSPEESSALLAAVAGACDAVVVLGGDGMVHLATQALALGDTPLGIVPAGTGNDTADVLGIPRDPMQACDAVLAALDERSVRRVDLGRTGEGTWWATVLCAGFDSAVNATANKLRWPRGPRRYDIAIGVEMLRLRPRMFRMRLDGELLEQPVTLVAIGNAPQYGGAKKITPYARMDDGLFSVAVVDAISRTTLARMAPTLDSAGHVNHPAVHFYSARTVELSAPGTLAYADGEFVAPLPLTTECVPAALPMLVPPAA
ncbi:MAG TPA: diacylglycerol kinase family protein [Jatrophihabitantaceae bacterium]|nr:diacylglycerol kinase family protein [Jatrophihabitantaceae bacterium]